MARRESREEEYIRRMRERGYVPTLAGMDDDDIEWELDKMDGKNPLEETRPAEQPLNPTYRPADPAMVARIYRQMGRPYDASLIPERERYYLNGWDNGEEEDGRDTPVERWPQGRSPLPQVREHLPVEPFDPWKNVWKLDWGPEGRPPERPRPRTEYQPGQFGPNVFGGGLAANAKGYWPGKYSEATGFRELAGGVEEGGGAASPQNAQNPNSWKVTGSRTERREKERIANASRAVTGINVLKEAYGLNKYWQEVYDAAYEKYKDHKIAADKAGEAVGWIGFATTGVTLITPEFPLAAAGGSFALGPLKDWVKKKVLESDHPKPEGELFPGNTAPPG